MSMRRESFLPPSLLLPSQVQQDGRMLNIQKYHMEVRRGIFSNQAPVVVAIHFYLFCIPSTNDPSITSKREGDDDNRTTTDCLVAEGSQVLTHIL